MYLTIITLSIGPDRSEQTVQTLIKAPKEQSDQGVHCLLFHLHVNHDDDDDDLHLLDRIMYCKTELFHFWIIIVIILDVPIFRTLFYGINFKKKI